MKKLKDILKEFKSQAYFNGDMKIGQVYSNPYARSFTNEDELKEDGLTLEQKQAFLEAVKNYKKYSESVYRTKDLDEVFESIKNLIEVANKVTVDETQHWFDNVTVSRHMKRMNESFKVFEKTLKEVSTLQQRLESSYDEIGEVLGKYYEINELEEGNEFGAARAKAIAAGEDSFEVDGKTYPVTKVGSDDKANAKKFAGESTNELKDSLPKFQVIDKQTGKVIDTDLKKDIAKRLAAKKTGWIIKPIGESVNEISPSRVKYKVGERVKIKDGHPWFGGKEAKITGYDKFHNNKNSFELYIKGHGKMSWFSPTDLRKIDESVNESTKLTDIIKKRVESVNEAIDEAIKSQGKAIKKGDKFRDDEGDLFTVTKVASNKIELKDEDGISTTFPDDFDDNNFDSWFVNELKDSLPKFQVIDKQTGKVIDTDLKKDIAKRLAAKKTGWIIKPIDESVNETKLNEGKIKVGERYGEFVIKNIFNSIQNYGDAIVLAHQSPQLPLFSKETKEDLWVYIKAGFYETKIHGRDIIEKSFDKLMTRVLKIASTKGYHHFNESTKLTDIIKKRVESVNENAFAVLEKNVWRAIQMSKYADGNDYLQKKLFRRVVDSIKGNKHIVSKISNIKTKLGKGLGDITITAKVDIELPDSEQKGKKNYKFTQRNLKYKAVIESVNESNESDIIDSFIKDLDNTNGILGAGSSDWGSDRIANIIIELKGTKNSYHRKHGSLYDTFNLDLRKVRTVITQLAKKHNLKIVGRVYTPKKYNWKDEFNSKQSGYEHNRVSFSVQIPRIEESVNESTKLTDIIKEALKPKDKKVVQAFYNQKPLEGKLLNTDGKTLEKLGMGGQDIAKWDGSSIVITAKSDVRSTDAILRYMKKYIPSGLWSSKTPISNWI